MTPLTELSTGCKTVLNTYYHPEVCIDPIECGHKAFGNYSNWIEEI